MRTVSPKFKNRPWAKMHGGIVPRLLDVKGFSGVLIHIGNSHEDTDGCVLVGENKVKGQVINSARIYHQLFGMMEDADKRGETITIEIL